MHGANCVHPPCAAVSRTVFRFGGFVVAHGSSSNVRACGQDFKTEAQTEPRLNCRLIQLGMQAWFYQRR
ncbi:hypothetical protein D3C87_2039750 [compost metagenome]